MHKVLCPRCKVDLHRRSTKNVLQFFCKSCMGFAVHWKDVPKVIGHEEFVKMKSTIEHFSDAPANCSHCQRKMKTFFHSEAGLEVDICVDCRLIWLDTGEWYDLSKAKNQKEIDPEKKIYARLLLELCKENDHLRRENLGEYVDPESLSGPKFAAALAGIPVEEDSTTKNPEWLRF